MLSMHRLLRWKRMRVSWAATTCACVHMCGKMQGIFLPAKGKSKKTTYAVHNRHAQTHVALWVAVPSLGGLFSKYTNRLKWLIVFWCTATANWEFDRFSRALTTFLLVIFLVCMERSQSFGILANFSCHCYNEFNPQQLATWGICLQTDCCCCTLGRLCCFRQALSRTKHLYK